MICSRQPNHRKQQQQKTTDRRTDEIGEQQEEEESCPGRPAPPPMIAGAAAHCSYCTKSRPRRRTDSHNWMYPASLSLSLSIFLASASNFSSGYSLSLSLRVRLFLLSLSLLPGREERSSGASATASTRRQMVLRFNSSSIPPLFPAVTINHGHPSFRFSPKKMKKNGQYV